MKAKFFAVLMAAFVILAMSGCATYWAKGVMPTLNDPSVDRTKLSTKTGDGIVVTAYPLTTKKEVKKYFDENLLDDGILAIAVDMDCSKATTLTAAILVPEGGAPVSPISAEEVYATIKRGYGLRTVAGWFFGLYIGAPILAYQTYRTNKRIQQDLDGVEGNAGKLLKLGNFPKGNMKGFLCFRVPDPATVKGSLKLVFQREGKLTEYNLDVN